MKAGMTPEQVLVALGQPRTRGADGFEYCTASGAQTVTFVNGKVARTS
ncbi:MAG: hypothetical protein JJD92_10265 [Frankiaceae bacterium]|nr:hypothetical protein [Frankiaceae bacterium]